MIQPRSSYTEQARVHEGSNIPTTIDQFVLFLKQLEKAGLSGEVAFKAVMKRSKMF